MSAVYKLCLAVSRSWFWFSWIALVTPNHTQPVFFHPQARPAVPSQADRQALGWDTVSRSLFREMDGWGMDGWMDRSLKGAG